MNRAIQVLIYSFALGSAAAVACIIPDKDIVIITSDPCGEEWVASTAGAYGYNGLGNPEPIKTVDESWVTKRYCVSAALGEQLVDPTSPLAADLISDIALACQERAIELKLGDVDQTCITTASLAFVGKCANPSGGCEPAPSTSGGETGFETETETGDEQPDLGSLDLRAEVGLANGEYVISSRLIATALADPLGLSHDGTTATQVRDSAGQPYGFQIAGVTSTNLGGVLGLQNRDIVIAVAEQPTATYEDLLELVAILLTAEAASVELERGTKTITLHYRRGS